MAITTMDDLVEEVLKRFAQGLYERGVYAARGDLEAGPITHLPDGTAQFEVFTCANNTDRVSLTVTIGAPPPSDYTAIVPDNGARHI